MISVKINDMMNTIEHERSKSQLQSSNQKSDRNLRTQMVNFQDHGYKKVDFKPFQVYMYDETGCLVNTQRRKKNPSVKKFIQKATDDLRAQIVYQRDYLMKVLIDSDSDMTSKILDQCTYRVS